MKINKKQISKCIFMSFGYTSPKISRDILQTGLFRKEMDGSVIPAYRNLQVAFETSDDLSKFEQLVRKQFLLDINDSYIYDCLSYADSQITNLGSDKYIASFPLSVIQKKEYRVVRVANGQRIDINGTYECGVKYDVISHVNGTINVNGIQIKNVKTNDHIIIDGINMLVTCNGANKFMDTNLKKFPTLMPGSTTVQISEGIEVSIGYYPIFM